MSSEGLTPTQVQRWTRIGVLSALAMLLGYLESFVPIPIPGVKLGLANIAVLVALEARDLRGAFFVGLVKVLATGLLFGNPVTLAYSATGTLLAFACMAPLSLLPTMRLWMVSVVGALAHEAGQLLVAQLLLGTPLVWYSAPVLGVAGCATGLLCGLVAERTAAAIGVGMAEPGAGLATSRGSRGETQGPFVARAALLMLAYLAFIAFAMHARNAGALAACLAVALGLSLAAHLQPRTMVAALAPTLPIALITLVAQVASAQRGTTLAALGPITLTQEALTQTAVMLVRLVSICCSSVAVVHLAGREGLAAGARWLLRPLHALGVRTEGPELAFSTAVRLVAALSGEVALHADRRAFLTKAFWAEELPAITRSLYEQACDRQG